MRRKTPDFSFSSCLWTKFLNLDFPWQRLERILRDRCSLSVRVRCASAAELIGREKRTIRSRQSGKWLKNEWLPGGGKRKKLEKVERETQREGERPQSSSVQLFNFRKERQITRSETFAALYWNELTEKLIPSDRKQISNFKIERPSFPAAER